MRDLAQAWPARTLAVADAQLLVRDTGPRDVPAVVLLHGLGGWGGEWWPVASLLQDRFRLVAFDQRGQGRSALKSRDFSRDAFVRDTATVIDDLDCGPVAVVGHSMGAHTALLTAAAHPELVTSLVLLEGGLGGEGSRATEKAISWFRQWPTPFTSRSEARAWFESNGYTSVAADTWANGLRQSPQGLVPSFLLDDLREQLHAVHARRRGKEWGAVACPTLVVKAANGFMPQAEVNAMLATNPHARALGVQGVGHDVHLDAPEETARNIRLHLDGERASAPQV